MRILQRFSMKRKQSRSFCEGKKGQPVSDSPFLNKRLPATPSRLNRRHRKQPLQIPRHHHVPLLFRSDYVGRTPLDRLLLASLVYAIGGRPSLLTSNAMPWCSRWNPLNSRWSSTNTVFLTPLTTLLWKQTIPTRLLTLYSKIP